MEEPAERHEDGFPEGGLKSESINSMEVMLFLLYQPGQASLPIINQAEPVFAEAGAVVSF